MKNKKLLLSAVFLFSALTGFAQYWNLAGNAGTSPYGKYVKVGMYWVWQAGQYCGTSDSTDFVIGTNNTQQMVVSAKGVVTIDNSLTVNQSASILGTMNVNGATALGSSLNVTGPSTLSSLSVTGASDLNSTLYVAGAAAFSNTLFIGGITTLNNSLNVTGASTLSSSLSVAGASTLSSSLNVVGDVTVGSNFPDPYEDCINVATSAANPYGVDIEPNTGSFPSGGAGVYVGGMGLGIETSASQNNNTNFGGILAASTNSSSIGIYGVVGEVSVPGANTYSYAGYFEGDVMSYGYYTSSDERLKAGITPMESSLDKLKQLNAYTYVFNNKYPQMHLPSGQQDGLLAQEVQKVFPELVRTNICPERYNRHGGKISDSVSTLAVNYIGLIPVIIDAMKEQDTKAANQESEIAQLKSALDSMKAMLTAITSASQNATLSVSSSSLQQNIPNPFTQSTCIHLNVASGVQNAELKIFNMNGVEIKSYTITTRGASQIIINANELAAGIYEYALIADGQLIDTKKMILTN